MPGSRVAVSPEVKEVVKWRISPVFVGRRIPDVKTESRLTRRERNSITRSSERLRHIITLMLTRAPTALYVLGCAELLTQRRCNQCAFRGLLDRRLSTVGDRRKGK